MKARAYVGTSGWNYKHWRNLIYEPKLPQRRWLEFIAARFDTVEVNTSFYRIPKGESVATWAASTPPSFLFALKLWRGITHYRKLVNSGQFTENFLKVAEALPLERRAPLLIQLPPNQGKDIDKLRAYINELRSVAQTPWDITVEFRNDAWLEPDVYRELDHLGVALCLQDMTGRAATDRPNDAPFVYVRRHGLNYNGSYTSDQIAADAARIRGWISEGRRVYIYYNNDIGGHAFWNASDLRAAVIMDLSPDD